MLTDATSKKTQRNNKPRSIDAGTNKQWSDKQRMEAIQTYLTLGNLALTARLLGIPEVTLRVWKTTSWWADAVNEMKSAEKIELSAKLKKIVNASLAVVEDRLVNGDFQFDQRSGEVVRKPVNMKDAHRVAVDLQQRQEVLEATENTSVTAEDTDSKLLKLAEKFADMATKKIEQKRLDQNTVDVSDAVEIKE